jgi:fibronectin type 3 domain-containing protein
MKARFSLAVVAVLLVFLGACGNDGGQTQPVIDTVPPIAPVGVQAESETSSAQITWTDNAEVDLAGYRIYKSSYSGGPYRLVNEGDLLLCPWYYDGVITPMASTFYKVTAVDESGNESAYSHAVGIYWNNAERPSPTTPADH